MYRRATTDDGNGHGFANGVAWNAGSAPGIRKLDFDKPLVDCTKRKPKPQAPVFVDLDQDVDIEQV
jgi:hypothetical protein